MRLLSIDVGTLSARAGLFSHEGSLLAMAARAFPLRRPAEDQAVYRLDDIWNAVTGAVQDCIAHSPGPVAVMAFDATSSLALAHEGAAPLDDGADVIAWMDHRGAALATEITVTKDRILAHMGGTLSPEMHLPKLLWLKRHEPAAWRRVTAVRDLCDALAYRATGVDAHSVCGLACKWAWLPHHAAEEGGDPWRRSLLARIGLEDLVGLGALSQPARPVGALHGTLQPAAAAAMHLAPGVRVAVGLIDGEAGTLGVLGAGFAQRMNRTLTVVGGTSICLMALAPEERMIPGVWGLYRDALVPGLWLHEAGQSLSGAALDAVLSHHPGGPRATGAVQHAAAACPALERMEAEGPAFAARRHMLPDWKGNRAPLGDARTRAMQIGIGEDTGPSAFLEWYTATARAIALQVRHIAEHLSAHGYTLDQFALAGGHANNPLLLRMYADALPGTLLVSEAAEPVLLGTAIVAACAAGAHPDLLSAAEAMAQSQQRVTPNRLWQTAHDKAYDIYRAMFGLRSQLKGEMDKLAGLGARQMS
jgi:FGGY-family pentulose kinase